MGLWSVKIFLINRGEKTNSFLLGSSAFPNISFKRNFSSEAVVNNIHSEQKIIGL